MNIHSHILCDALPSRRDPTQCQDIRSRLETLVRRAVFKWRSDVHNALVTQDSLGIGRLTMFSIPTHYMLDKLQAFIKNSAIRHLATVSTAIEDYIRTVYYRGQKKVQSEEDALVKDAKHSRKASIIARLSGAASLYSKQAINDLRGVLDASYQAASRLTTLGLTAGDSALQLFNRISKAVFIDVALNRLKMMINTMISLAYNSGKLDAYVEKGVKEVGIRAEGVSKPKLVKGAFGNKGSRQTYVTILTAGDDRVCERCESFEGITYTLAYARGLLPIHPNCRCVVVPATDKRFGKVPARDVWDPAEHPREASGTEKGGQFAHKGSGLSYEVARERLLAAGSSFSTKAELMPDTEDEAADLLIASLEHKEALLASAPKAEYPKEARYGSPEYTAYTAATELHSALSYLAQARLMEMIKSPEIQRRVADAWLFHGADKDSIIPSEMFNRFYAEVLDHVGNHLPAEYNGSLNMYSPDFEKFAPSFIRMWLLSGGTRAQFNAGQAAKDIDGNVGKEFYEGEKYANSPTQNRRESEPHLFSKSKNVEANLHKLYEQTQAFYQKKLNKKNQPPYDLTKETLLVQRGVGGAPEDNQFYRPWAAESWTTDKNTPKRFGRMMGRGWYERYSILTAAVPYSGILMSYEAQKQYWLPEKELKGKKEIVVLGGALQNLQVDDGSS